MDTTTLTEAILLAGVSAFLAVVLATRHIHKHLSHYRKPQYQLHIVRILAMVPIYSLTSWFALVSSDNHHILILELVRDSYEAYVVYNFVVLLINYAGGDYHLCRYLEGQPRMPHPWPGSLWLPPLKLGPEFLNSVRASVLQFVFVKPAGTMIKLYIFTHDDYAVRMLGIILVNIINNLSISCALYGLVLFYHAAHELLLPFRPFEKFLSVKAVVFFSFWQGIALSIAVRTGLLQEVEGFTANEMVTGLQDVLICVEMAIAAVFHYFIFSHREYESCDGVDVCGEYSSQYPLLHVVDIRDVLSDAKDRLYGGVGFEAELREKEPIVPSIDNIFGDEPPLDIQYSGPRQLDSESSTFDRNR